MIKETKMENYQEMCIRDSISSCCFRKLHIPTDSQTYFTELTVPDRKAVAWRKIFQLGSGEKIFVIGEYDLTCSVED